ncbi:MAG TPA: hypothetical protein VIZ31_11740 [Vicinamibacteria bacterium]
MPSPAQREAADVEWQKRHAKIEYGVVAVGRHKLDELAVGTTWRMGRNEASVLTTEMALLAGEQIIVPGSYRVNVARQTEPDFALSIDGGSVGEAPQGAPVAVPAKAEVLKPDKPTKGLEVTFKTDGKADGTVQPAKVTVTFGENRITAALGLVATKPQKAQGWTLEVFQLPAELVEKRLAGGKATPVLSLKKETGKRQAPFHVWNLSVGKEAAELWPAPAAPTDSFGFGTVKQLDAASMTKATSVTWEDAKDAKPALELSKVDVAKGKGLSIVLLVGKQTCTIAIPEPKLPD